MALCFPSVDLTMCWMFCLVLGTSFSFFQSSGVMGQQRYSASNSLRIACHTVDTNLVMLDLLTLNQQERAVTSPVARYIWVAAGLRPIKEFGTI